MVLNTDTFLKPILFFLEIFGRQNVLRPGYDDEALLQLLECSDIDISSDEDTEEFKKIEEEGQGDVPQNEEEEDFGENYV